MNTTCIKCSQPIEPGKDNVHYGLHTACFLNWFALEEPKEFSEIVRRSNDSKEPTRNNQVESWARSFFHGKFKKYSAVLVDESYIFKVREDQYPELPDVEYVCNQIASTLGIPVAEYYLINFLEERTFVTKNFIKKNASTTSLNHIWHYLKDGQEYNCENILNIIANETESFTNIEVFIKTCLFDALLGNHDRHGRNLGLIVTPKGNTLAPIYDNSSALGLERGEFLKAQFEPKGKLYTKESREPTIKHYIQEFRRLEYPDVIEGFAQKVQPEKITLLLENSHCSSLMKGALKNLFNKRYEEMKNELQS